MTFEKYWQDNYASRGYQYGEEAMSLVKMGWEMHEKYIEQRHDELVAYLLKTRESAFILGR